jgi:hypothetical protein
MAHYDTKSQLLPTGVRVGLVVAAALLCAALALRGLAAEAGLAGPPAAAGPWGAAAAVVLLLAALAANVTGNRSPGALDNGSAVGTLLELARCWRPLPGAPAEVLWVASGSEEVGLDGARHFLRSRER